MGTDEVAAATHRRRAASGVLVRDEAGRVLLVEPTYKPRWEIPGGMVEPGESPRRAAGRECREELGLDLAVGRLLVVEHRTASHPLGESVLFLYDGGRLPNGATIVLPPEELASWRFVTADEVRALAGERKAARVAAGLDALRHGTVVELSDD